MGWGCGDVDGCGEVDGCGDNGADGGDGTYGTGDTDGEDINGNVSGGTGVEMFGSTGTSSGPSPEQSSLFFLL